MAIERCIAFAKPQRSKNLVLPGATLSGHLATQFLHSDGSIVISTKSSHIVTIS